MPITVTDITNAQANELVKLERRVKALREKKEAIKSEEYAKADTVIATIAGEIDVKIGNAQTRLNEIKALVE